MIYPKRRVAALATLSALALITAACSTGGGANTTAGSSGGAAGTPVSGGTLNMLGIGDVDYMDPNITYYSAGQDLQRMVARTLMSFQAVEGKTTESAPDLAAATPSLGADGVTYTVRIRQGVMWNTSPARQVTAADVVRGLKRSCNPVQSFGGMPDIQPLIAGLDAYCNAFAKVKPDAASMAAYQNSHEISGYTATDDKTLTIKLTHPASYFGSMMVLSPFAAAPKEYDAYVPASNEIQQKVISDGPYKIDSYVPTKSIALSRNPAWTADSDPIRKAYVDKILIDETQQQEVIQQQLQTGTPSADMEWDTFPTPTQAQQLIAAKDPQLNLGPSSATNPYVVFNTVSPNNNKALQSVPVRQAIAQAINRANILQVLGGNQVDPPLTHILPAVIKGGENNFDLYPFDLAKAQAGLQAAGASSLNLKVLYRSASKGSTAVFQTLQQDLGKAGITVTGVAATNADFYTKYLQKPDVAKSGTWDVAIAGWSPDWYGDAALSFFGPLFQGQTSFPPNGSNFGLYNNDAVNKAIDDAAKTSDPTQSAAKWAALDKQVMQDMPMFPLTSPNTANYRAKQVQNAIFIPIMQNFDAMNMWITKDKQG